MRWRRQPLSSSVGAVWKVAVSTRTTDRAVFSRLKKKFSACNVRRRSVLLATSGILDLSIDLGSIPARAARFNHVMTLRKLRNSQCMPENV